MNTKCIIVDDEPLAIEVIENHLSKISGFAVVKKCSSAIEAFEVLKTRKVDLMFLDIQMPELTGMEFLRTTGNPPKVIITTAHRKYALEGYELDVVDYLLKPISFERFFKAINKFTTAVDMPVQISSDELTAGEMRDFLYVKENKKVVKIHLNDILFIESIKDYITIHTIDRRIITKMTIGRMEEELPENRFLRIHRSFIVSIDKIDAFTASSIEIGKKELVIGRSYKHNVLKVLNYSSGNI
jgi:DNA-binding LytR/AlgR family response regulator